MVITQAAKENISDVLDYDEQVSHLLGAQLMVSRIPCQNNFYIIVELRRRLVNSSVFSRSRSTVDRLFYDSSSKVLKLVRLINL